MMGRFLQVCLFKFDIAKQGILAIHYTTLNSAESFLIRACPS